MYEKSYWNFFGVWYAKRITIVSETVEGLHWLELTSVRSFIAIKSKNTYYDNIANGNQTDLYRQ